MVGLSRRLSGLVVSGGRCWAWRRRSSTSAVSQQEVELVHAGSLTSLEGFALIPDFVTPDEEAALLAELEPRLKRMRYQYDHWDDAIHGFREIERTDWTPANRLVIDRLQQAAFGPSDGPLLPHVHVLDLADNGWIKPHIDSVKFCGPTIAGISLLSDSVMKLERESDSAAVLAHLRRRSLYIMTGPIRYEFKHSILSNEQSLFREEKVLKTRRISIICRSEPLDNEETQ